ncbi:hypothetical protein GGR21_002137 [Dysgonomonas hofstadii]|uniref:DUF4890 domain-containing protein n=1 Tax=Dysgonomonas hofstadii TaxID=637886 RepID=A0A840CLJ7_9BACT|nr:hypothetical protein [Dysgonomonas hofstadii]MBB4036236.1 hypothetical protein [Dysgonomonas hofstadii]
MKSKNILILTLLISFVFSVTVGAQDKPKRSFDVEALKKEKAEFLKKELNLTDAEAKAFLPLESELTEKKFEIYRDARIKTRELRRKKDKTDADFQKITQANLEAERKELDLQVEYYKKFNNVLPAEKVEKYRAADIKFKEAALKRHREQHRHGENRNK